MPTAEIKNTPEPNGPRWVPDAFHVAISNALPVLFAYVDMQRRILHANERHEEWFGRPVDAILGEDYMTIFEDLSFRILANNKLKEAMDGATIGFETKLTTKGGVAHDVCIRLEPQADHGTIVGILIMILDRAEYRKTEDQDWVPQKMEALERLTGNVVHEFSNMLTVVKGHIELLSEILPADEYMQTLVSGAQRGVERTEHSINQLIEFSRVQQIEAKATDLDKAVAASVDKVRHIVSETIDVLFEPSPISGFCYMEQQRFEDAIISLAVNARAAMRDRDRGRLTIELAEVKSSAIHGYGNAATDAKYAKLTISHTGAGIKHENLHKIFEPFFTADVSQRVDGIGLSTVYGFVRRSGGKIDAANIPGSGMRYTIFLPLCEPRGRLSDAAEQQTNCRQYGQKSILVVDGQDDLRNFVATALRRMGYLVQVCANGSDAIAVLNADSSFELLLADFQLPNGMDGAELALQYVRRNRNGKILMMSGANDFPRKIMEADAGSYGVIRKPFTGKQLSEAVGSLVQDEQNNRDNQFCT